MPRNGSGLYTLPAGNPVVTQTLITSNWANTTLSDLALAITNSLAKDGQTTPTANLPMGGFRHTSVGDPTLRNQYASLGYVQDGNHLRLTALAGVNAITATLAGGSAALVNGQIVQIIPTAANTGPVTLNVNAIGAKPVVTSAGKPLGAGSFDIGKPYLLQYDGVSFVLLTGDGASTIMQSTITGWDRPSGGTYPDLAVVDPATISIPAGTGRIVAPSSTDASTSIDVSWPAQNVAISGLAGAWSTVIGINSSGNVVQLTGQFQSSWVRDYILLGVVTHINGQVNGVTTQPTVFGDMAYAAYDIGTVLKDTFLTGGVLSPNLVNNLHIDLSGGQLFSLGINADATNSPNVKVLPNQLDLQFFPITGTSGVGVATQNVPVTFYDPNGAGTVTAIPGGASTATIHRVYMLNGTFVFLYGQNTYADLDTALAQIGVDNADLVIPAKLLNATFLGAIVAQKDATDLKDVTKARFMARGSFGSSGGAGGSISDAPVNGLTYGRKDSAWTEVVPSPKGAQATFRLVNYQTNTFNRFAAGLDDTPEAGGNSGSNWVLRAYNDAGTFTGNAMEVTRSTRAVNFPGNVTVAGTSTLTGAVSAPGGITGNLAGNVAGNVSGTAGSAAVWTTARTITIGATGKSVNGSANVSWNLAEIGAQAAGNYVDIASAQTITGAKTFGNGAGQQVVSIDGGASGAANGSAIYFKHAGTFRSGIGDYSAIQGGAYDDRFEIYSPSGIRLEHATSINSTLTVAGSIIYNENIISSTANFVIGTTGAGSVYLRPNGIGSTSGQALLGSTGVMQLNPTAPNPSNANTFALQLVGTYGGGIDYVDGNVRFAQYNNSGRHIIGRNNGAGGTSVSEVASFGPGGGTDTLKVTGEITAAGAINSLGFQNRDNTAIKWLWYCTGDIARLYRDPGGDITTVTNGGVWTSTNFIASSDRRLKNIGDRQEPRDFSPINLFHFTWKGNGEAGFGPIAQDILRVAPEHVTEGEDGMLAIDKGGIAIEWAASLEAKLSKALDRIDELENIVSQLRGAL